MAHIVTNIHNFVLLLSVFFALRFSTFDLPPFPDFSLASSFTLPFAAACFALRPRPIRNGTTSRYVKARGSLRGLILAVAGEMRTVFVLQPQSVSTLIAVTGTMPAGEYFSQSYVALQTTASTPSLGPAATSTQQQGDEWRHTAQACAILGNLIGPNGERLTSTDPYNTTVFVGGLSSLVGEDTLRTFFVSFGEKHYVKMPVASEALWVCAGFPVGGSRIRLIEATDFGAGVDVHTTAPRSWQ
ncbi:hypothetical protein C8R45DRAFT_1185435 [Mycena sanguinolenta]|nr:hypothetical protein C8R45DRAFT_1185435 [Mycena sanguinolenta]